MDYITPLTSFLGSILGSGLSVAVFNYYAEHRKNTIAIQQKLKTNLARLYDYAHRGNIQPLEFTQLASSVCIDLDANKRFKDAAGIRAILANWQPGTDINTSDIKEVLKSILEHC